MSMAQMCLQTGRYVPKNAHNKWSICLFYFSYLDDVQINKI